jgi:hypothetical protein
VNQVKYFTLMTIKFEKKNRTIWKLLSSNLW